jgi:hypothetical protein
VYRIPDKLVSDYLAATLGYAGSRGRHSAELLASAMTVFRRVVSAGHAHLPFHLALDLRVLAQQGHELAYADGDLPGYDSLLRARYENELLNRLLREHRVQQALELVAFYRAQIDTDADGAFLQSDANRDRRAAFQARAERLAALLLERLAPHWPDTWSLNPAHLRGRVVPALSDDDLLLARDRWDKGSARITSAAPHDLAAPLLAFLDSLTGAAVGAAPPVVWSQLIALQDLFELEHLEALHREHLRLGARHMIEVMTSIPELDPHDIELHEEESEVESLFMDESYYPTGGFSELTNRGSFENMVLSELIYMGEFVDDSPHLPVHQRVDLFDIRYVEGELLFYTRDSGQLQRKRRLVRLIIDARQPLDLKYPEHTHQLRTLVAGAVLALVRDLSQLFHNDALLFHLHLLTEDVEDDKASAQARQLAEILEILLAHPIKNKLLTLSLDDNLRWDELGLPRRKTYALLFTSDKRLLRDLPPTFSALRKHAPPLFGALINLSGAPVTSLAPERVYDLALRPDALRDLQRALLLDLMHGRQPAAPAADVEDPQDNP